MASALLLGGAAAPGAPGAPGPPCLGAAARDPDAQPCSRAGLDYSVTPAPSVAELETTGDRCTTKVHTATWWLCVLGPPGGTRTFALVGDSHAGHWRPALAGLADANGWRGISMTRSGCPLSAAIPDLPAPLGGQCVTWNRRVGHWLRHHRKVGLVFVSEHAGAGVVVPRGRRAFATRVAGYREAWAALPESVRHIVVLRDTPVDTHNSFACVVRALARHTRAGQVCAVPRARALPADPAVVAARREGPRVQVIDLTRFMCSRRLCYPVVGGVLVHRDVDHLTPEFSDTLAGPLGRALARLMSIGDWS